MSPELTLGIDLDELKKEELVARVTCKIDILTDQLLAGDISEDKFIEGLNKLGA